MIRFANLQNGEIQSKQGVDGDRRAEVIFNAIIKTVGLDNTPADTSAVVDRLKGIEGWSGQWTRNMDRKLAQYAAKLDPKALARDHRVSPDLKHDFQRVVTQLMAVREAYAKDGKVAASDVDLTRIDSIRRDVIKANAARAAQERSRKQSEAAKKGWETRRANEAASATGADVVSKDAQAEAAKRSEAAKKGWETRRANEAAKRAAEATAAAASAENARRVAEAKRAADEAAAQRAATEQRHAAEATAARQRQQQAAEAARQQQAAEAAARQRQQQAAEAAARQRQQDAEAAAAARRAEDEQRRRSEAAMRGWETRRANEAAAAAAAAYTPPSAGYYQSSGSADGRELHIGPRGGTFYYTESGNKRYTK